MNYSKYCSVQLDSCLIQKFNKDIRRKNDISNGLFKVLFGSTRFLFDPKISIKIYEKNHISNGLFKVLFDSTKFLFDAKILIKIYDKKSH